MICFLPKLARIFNMFLFLFTLLPAQEVLPKTNDTVLQRIFQRKILFYEHKRVYQDGGGVHDPFYNISAYKEGGKTDKPMEPHGNPNIEFPWGKSAGTHRSSVTIKRFHYIPGSIKYYNTTKDVPDRSPSTEEVIEWVFPEGTIFGEIFYIENLPFEVRVREKKNNKWVPNVWRPVTSREEYDGLVPGQKRNIKIKTLDAHTFKNTAAVDMLSPISSSKVKELLSLPFKSVKNKAWVVYNGVEGFAPSTLSEFHIVPKNYDGAHIEVSQKGCMQCHSDTLKSVNHFNVNRKVSLSKEWYGFTRGSDNIFSYHIFDEDCISSNGFILPIQIRNKK
jgi:hypothetical protein